MALNGSHRMAEYVRNEPAVRNVRRWEDSPVDGLIVQTEHYTLYTTLLEPLMLRQMPAFLESAYKAYQSQLPQPIPAGQPLEVYLFDFNRSIYGEHLEVEFCHKIRDEKKFGSLDELREQIARDVEVARGMR